jgi:hypothetical protein
MIPLVWKNVLTCRGAVRIRAGRSGTERLGRLCAGHCGGDAAPDFAGFSWRRCWRGCALLAPPNEVKDGPAAHIGLCSRRRRPRRSRRGTGRLQRACIGNRSRLPTAHRRRLGAASQLLRHSLAPAPAPHALRPASLGRGRSGCGWRRLQILAWRRCQLADTRWRRRPLLRTRIFQMCTSK